MDTPPIYQNLDGKKKSYFALAAKMACQSTYDSYRHGAVLVKGGSVISVGFNKENTCSFGQRFRKFKTGNATLHAELSAVLGLDRSATDKADIYVVRVGRLYDFKMSKPCPMCEEVLRFCGVSRVFYSVDCDHWELMKI